MHPDFINVCPRVITAYELEQEQDAYIKRELNLQEVFV